MTSSSHCFFPFYNGSQLLSPGSQRMNNLPLSPCSGRSHTYNTSGLRRCLLKLFSFLERERRLRGNVSNVLSLLCK